MPPHSPFAIRLALRPRAPAVDEDTMTNRITAATAIDKTLIANLPRFTLCSYSNAARISEQSLRGEAERFAAGRGLILDSELRTFGVSPERRGTQPVCVVGK